MGQTEDAATILVLLGPPGGGKGTQAKRLVGEFDLVHYSTGDILREEVRRDSEIGRRAKAIMEAGELVPDEVLGEIVRGRLQDLDGKGGCILDGYPRTVAQARFLEEIRDGMPLIVVNITVDEEQIVKRLSGRRFCPNCGSIYNIYFSPPKEGGRCDRCGAELERRKDDHEDVIRERLRVYNDQTRPVVGFYRGWPTYFEVDGNQEPAVVFDEIRRIVGTRTR
jgi:adenylate kinase